MNASQKTVVYQCHPHIYQCHQQDVHLGHHALACA